MSIILDKLRFHSDNFKMYAKCLNKKSVKCLNKTDLYNLSVYPLINLSIEQYLSEFFPLLTKSQFEDYHNIIHIWVYKIETTADYKMSSEEVFHIDLSSSALALEEQLYELYYKIIN
jgi:hypothetical protein